MYVLELALRERYEMLGTNSLKLLAYFLNNLKPTSGVHTIQFPSMLSAAVKTVLTLTLTFVSSGL